MSFMRVQTNEIIKLEVGAFKSLNETNFHFNITRGDWGKMLNLHSNNDLVLN